MGRSGTSRCGGCFEWVGGTRAGLKNGSDASATADGAAAGSVDYDDDFFDGPIGDRGAVFSVKYGLRGVLFGEAAAEAIPLWVADMDLPCAPEICRAIQRRAAHPTFGYTYQPPEMWQAAQRWLREEHGWEVPLEAFVFCCGVVPAAAAALWAYTGEGDEVLLMTPLYEPLQKVVLGAQRRLRTHELRLRGGQYVLDRKRLQAELRGCKLLLFCNPHNPGGRAWSSDELRMVAELCRQEGVLMVSDEIWADWCVFGHKHRPMALEAAPGQGVVTLMAPTKTWNLAGLHSAFLVIEDRALRERYLAEVDYAFLHFGSTFASEGALAAYTLGRPWLRAAKRYIEGQLQRCMAFLQERCSPEIVPIRPQATYLLWLDCTRLATSDPARFFREEAGLILSPGADFGGAATVRFVRLNTATSRETLGRALEQMAAAVEKIRAGFRPSWEPAWTS